MSLTSERLEGTRILINGEPLPIEFIQKPESPTIIIIKLEEDMRKAEANLISKTIKDVLGENVHPIFISGTDTKIEKAGVENFITKMLKEKLVSTSVLRHICDIYDYGVEEDSAEYELSDDQFEILDYLSRRFHTYGTSFWSPSEILDGLELKDKDEIWVSSRCQKMHPYGLVDTLVMPEESDRYRINIHGIDRVKQERNERQVTNKTIDKT